MDLIFTLPPEETDSAGDIERTLNALLVAGPAVVSHIRSENCV